MPTTQHSNYGGYAYASLGVDGNFNPDFNAGSCASSEWVDNPWWIIDLQDDLVINCVSVTATNNWCKCNTSTNQ